MTQSISETDAYIVHVSCFLYCNEFYHTASRGHGLTLLQVVDQRCPVEITKLRLSWIFIVGQPTVLMLVQKQFHSSLILCTRSSSVYCLYSAFLFSPNSRKGSSLSPYMDNANAESPPGKVFSLIKQALVVLIDTLSPCWYFALADSLASQVLILSPSFICTFQLSTRVSSSWVFWWREEVSVSRVLLQCDQLTYLVRTRSAQQPLIVAGCSLLILQPARRLQ